MIYDSHRAYAHLREQSHYAGEATRSREMEMVRLGEQLSKLVIENERLKREVKTLRAAELERLELEISVLNKPWDRTQEYHVYFSMDDYERAMLRKDSAIVAAIIEGVASKILELFSGDGR